MSSVDAIILWFHVHVPKLDGAGSIPGPRTLTFSDVDGAVGTKSQSSLSGSRPGFDEIAALIKDANALVAAIRNKETTTGINGHGMRKVKFARPASFDAADDPDELSPLS